MKFDDNFKKRSVDITAENSLYNIQKEMAEKIIELKNKENELIKENEIKVKELISQEERAKAYGYDSLVYRFNDYQARAFPMEVIDYKYTRLLLKLKLEKKLEIDIIEI